MKKSQSGNNAAVLVAVIGALIIIFVLFSSTEERREFLNETKTKSTNTNGNQENIILLLEHPGTLIYLTKNEIEHELPSINLYSKTESLILKSVDSLYIKNSIFSKQEKQIGFKVENKDNMDNLLLSFNAVVHKGRLIINLNGNEIYNNQILSQIIAPIPIDPEMLMEDNVLTFSVSGVGFRFWAVNEYNLEKLKITADTTDVSTQTSDVVFMVDKQEEYNLEKATLRFVPECEVGNVGKLEIFINTYQIYSSVPDCGVPYPLEFSHTYLSEGENRVLFKSQEGKYLIDRISVKTKLRENPSYTYKFDITKDQFNDIQKGKFDVNLTLRFFDDFEEKAADIYINGENRITIPRTKASVFTRKLNKVYVEKDTNTLKIVPKTNLEIDDLEVALIET